MVRSGTGRRPRTGAAGALAAGLLLTGCAQLGADTPDLVTVDEMDHPCEFFTEAEREELGLGEGRAVGEDSDDYEMCMFTGPFPFGQSSTRVASVNVTFRDHDASAVATAHRNRDLPRIAYERVREGVYQYEAQSGTDISCYRLVQAGASASAEVQVVLSSLESHPSACEAVSEVAPVIEDKTAVG